MGSPVRIGVWSFKIHPRFLSVRDGASIGIGDAVWDPGASEPSMPYRF